MQERLYRIEELAEETGVSVRNIRFYTAEGLLPPPDARGRYALYADEHAQRLRLIQRLKADFLPLDVIRAELARLTDDQVVALLAEPTPTAPGAVASSVMAPPAQARETPDTAAGYIARVLAKRRAALPSRPAPAPVPPAPSESDEEGDSETWERFTLAPGVELHARRKDDFVQKLISYARTLRRPGR